VDVPKSVRLEVFLERLKNAQPASTHDEAYELLCTVLNRVEDEMTTIPFDPSRWQTDGRMYPPQPDSVRAVPNHPNLKRYRSRGHDTYIAENGAIQIAAPAAMGGRVHLSKRGLDGKDVWGR
jgi:hypothetical protein